MTKTMNRSNEKAAFVPPISTISLDNLEPTATEFAASPGGWFTCEVGYAGPAEDGNIYICLKDVGGAFPFQWYYAVSTERKEMLATALAALTSGFKVATYLTSKDPYSQINRLYISRF